MDNIFFAKIFLNQYHRKMAEMKAEYELDFVLSGFKVFIYSAAPISKVFEYEIIAMRKKLKSMIFDN